MKGMTAFACIGDVDDSLIAESLSIFENPYVSALKEYRRERRRAFFQSPLWAAMICAVVSLSVLSAIVMAGNGVFTPPAATPPETEITATETDIQEPTEPETERRPASTLPNWQYGVPEDPTPQRPTVPEVTVDWNGYLPGYGSPPVIDWEEPRPNKPTIPGQNNSSGPVRNPNLNPNPWIP